MYILHIHTASPQVFVAMDMPAGQSDIRTMDITQDTQTFIHEAVQNLLDDLHVTLHTLDAICVTLGPGSYTSLRIGLAAAKGLCWALHKPLIGLSLLELIAYNAHQENPNMYTALMYAKQNQLYMQPFSKSGAAICPATLVEHPYMLTSLSTPVCLAYEMQEISKVLPEQNIRSLSVNASTFMAMGRNKFYASTFENIATIEPYYIQNPYL